MPSLLMPVETGLPGVALVLPFGQLVSQILVEEFTVQFSNLPAASSAFGCRWRPSTWA
jgi:hypothetical protein